VALALAVAACGGDRTSAGGPSQPALRPIVLPNLSGVDERARTSLEAAQARVTAGSAGSVAAGDLAAAYGDLGLLLMASEFVDAAEPSLANASALAPDDPRWAYYLAHAHKRRGDIEQAATGFERVLAIAPDTRVAVWWLGAMRLEQGRAEEAEALFSRVREDPAFELAARYGLGRAALLRQDYQSAATHLEAVLALNREAVAAHYPLGLAYRGLGRTADAEAQMRRRSGTDILPPDPWIDTLAGLVETAEAHYGLGVEASRAGAWSEAAAAFRRALELDPGHGPARVNLSVALYRLNDEAGALAEAARALAVPGSEARAHFVMGTIVGVAGAHFVL
jgi:tetratricopeptide (TPR) repeat protein